MPITDLAVVTLVRELRFAIHRLSLWALGSNICSISPVGAFTIMCASLFVHSIVLIEIIRRLKWF